MTKNPLTPDCRAPRSGARERVAVAAVSLLLAAAAPRPPDSETKSATGHATLGDSVLPQGVRPAARRAWMARQSALCLVAVADATARYHLPQGLLGAVSRVETGRPLPVTGDRQPWPWTVNADGASLFFDTRAQAVAETQRVLARGAHFVDIGCMQVDLAMHRTAFASLEEAFNPAANTDYAARLLLSLHGGKRDWAAASGLYHSGTPGLMEPYQAQVAHMRATQHPTLGK